VQENPAGTGRIETPSPPNCGSLHHRRENRKITQAARTGEAKSPLSSAVAGEVSLAPGGHRNEDRFKTLSVPGERIFDPRRDLREDPSVNHFVMLEFAEMLGQHFLGSSGNQALKFAKAMGAALEEVDDHRLPFAAEHFGGEFNRATIFSHPPNLQKIPGDKKVPTTRKGTLA
jgi:hypothetical protein